MAVEKAARTYLRDYFLRLTGPEQVPEFTATRYRAEAESALARNPHDVDALEVLGALADRDQDASSALHYFRRASLVQPDATRCLNLCIALIATGERAEALQWLNEVLEREPEIFDDDALGVWATTVAVHVLAANGRYGAATDLMNVALRDCDSSHPRQLLWLIKAAQALGEPATAVDLAGRLLVVLGRAEWNPEGGIATLRDAPDDALRDLHLDTERELAVWLSECAELRGAGPVPSEGCEPDPDYVDVVDATMQAYAGLRGRAWSASLGADRAS